MSVHEDQLDRLYRENARRELEELAQNVPFDDSTLQQILGWIRTGAENPAVAGEGEDPLFDADGEPQPAQGAAEDPGVADELDRYTDRFGDDTTAAEEELAAALSDRNATGGRATQQPIGPAVWEVRFAGPEGEAMRRKIAATAFDNIEEVFGLRVHRAGNGSIELEMVPPPRKADVRILARFRTGDERVFVLEVPAEAKVPDIDPSAIRLATRSDPCDPLLTAAWEIAQVEVAEEGGEPILRLW